MSLHPLERHHVENAPSTVQVDGLEFHKACLHRLPLTLRLGVLRDPMAIKEPGWIDAARELGMFSMLNLSPHETKKTAWSSAALHPMEQVGLAALVGSLVEPNTSPMGLSLSDPHNGDQLPARSDDDLHLEWSAGVTRAFRRVLSDFAMDHATATSSFRRQPAKSWSPENRATHAQFEANAAMLLAAACAGGDTEGVRLIVQDFPRAIHTPLTTRAMNGGASPWDQHCTVSPAMLAARHNRLEVLDLLVQLGWDPLGPIHWRNNVASHPKSFAGPNNRSVVTRDANDAFAALSMTLIDTDDWRPSTVEFFLKAFNRQSSADRPQARLDAIATLSREIISDQREGLLPAFLRQDMFSLNPATNAISAASNCREDVLEALRHDIDWSRHAGADFLPHLVIVSAVPASGTGKGATAPREALAHKLSTWCIDDGRADLVIGSHAAYQTPNERAVSPTHDNAALGLNSLVLLALEHGADPNEKHSGTGRTVIEAALAQGHQDTAHLIRSFQARQAMMSALQDQEDVLAATTPRFGTPPQTPSRSAPSPAH